MSETLKYEHIGPAINECINLEKLEKWLKSLNIRPRDMVEVTRCKDCQFFDPNDIPSVQMPDMRRCAWLKIVMKEDSYCSYAKRKKEE